MNLIDFWSFTFAGLTKDNSKKNKLWLLLLQIITLVTIIGGLHLLIAYLWNP